MCCLNETNSTWFDCLSNKVGDTNLNRKCTICLQCSLKLALWERPGNPLVQGCRRVKGNLTEIVTCAGLHVVKKVKHLLFHPCIAMFCVFRQSSHFRRLNLGIAQTHMLLVEVMDVITMLKVRGRRCSNIWPWPAVSAVSWSQRASPAWASHGR